MKKFLAGDRLPSETELCTQFSVSRTAIREALRMLSAKGLISIEKGKGMFVKESSPEMLTDQMHLYLQLNVDRNYVLDIVHARQIIEPAMAALAATNHTDEDAGKLFDDLEKFRVCEGPIADLAALDMQFHLDISRASQNLIMPLVLAPIHRMMPEIKSVVYATNDDARQSALIWHQKIFDAIIRRDDEGARQAMTQHLRIAEEHAEKMLKKQQQSRFIE